jgi:moderate conductance mechanosensitive channel
MNFAMTPRTAVILSIMALLMLFSMASSQAQTSAAPPPGKVADLIKLLDDPEVQGWLNARAQPPAETSEDAAAESLALWEGAVRSRITSLKNAVPQVPVEVAGAVDIIQRDVNAGQPGKALLILAVLLAVGSGAEWLFRKALYKAPLQTAQSTPAERPLSLLFELVPLLVFAFASAGLFLAFEWPPLLRRIVLTYLSAIVAFRFIRAVALILLRPAGRQGVAGRLLDLDDQQAAFWFRRLQLFAGIFLLGWAIASLMPALGFSVGVQRLFTFTFGLGLLAIGIEIVWRRPAVVAGSTLATPRSGLLTALLALLWVCWVVGMNGLLWIGIYALLLPPTVRGVGHATARLTRHAEPERLLQILFNVLVIRGARALVIGAAVGWLAYVFRVTSTVVGHSPLVERLVEGVFHGVVVLLIADLLWQLSKVYIEHRLELAGHGSTADEISRSGRLRTLLPIFRNSLAVFIAVVAALTILSGLGVQIMPLVAGAGIFGVAIGFGSQTLVKDVLSGVFYMLDDAFRVGEYIQSGSYKGTVESFSLRSVRLRHHRGPVFTVPFGDLGAVQNMSRDWVVEKMTMTVTYDSDIEQARKLIKKIGQELAADPEFASSTIQPLKMQGVDSFGDSGIVLNMKLTTKPGEQFGIKRKAFVMIKKAFDENGIKLAVPTVQVSGGDESANAAAGDMLRRRAKAAKDAAATAA